VHEIVRQVAPKIAGAGVLFVFPAPAKIRRMVNLVAPAAGRETDCGEEIAHRFSLWGFDDVPKEERHRLPIKERHKAVSRLKAALERVEHAAHPLLHDGEVFAPGIPFDWTKTLKPLIDGWKRRCDVIIANTKPHRARRNADKQRWAATQAFEIMRDYHPRPQSVGIKRLAQLAAEFYGANAPDMTKYCRAVRARAAKPGTK
jgi:hypothetical protein